MPRICIVPVVNTGGMASFRAKFEAGLRKRGIDVTHDPDDEAEAILVIGGTRHLLPLWRAKRRGLRVVQRLDGVNWVQRVRWSGIRYTLRAEYGNALLAFIRNRIADRVIYQSEFIRNWWEDWYGVARVPAQVIINGVDLDTYTPGGQNADFVPTSLSYPGSGRQPGWRAGYGSSGGGTTGRNLIHYFSDQADGCGQG